MFYWGAKVPEVRILHEKGKKYFLNIAENSGKLSDGNLRKKKSDSDGALTFSKFSFCCEGATLFHTQLQP